MMSVTDVIKELLDTNNLKMKILKVLWGERELTSSEILKELDLDSNINFEKDIEYLDKATLIDTIYTKNENIYKLRSRGRSLIIIAEMIEEEERTLGWMRC